MEEEKSHDHTKCPLVTAMNKARAVAKVQPIVVGNRVSRVDEEIVEDLRDVVKGLKAEIEGVTARLGKLEKAKPKGKPAKAKPARASTTSAPKKPSKGKGKAKDSDEEEEEKPKPKKGPKAKKGKASAE